ASPAEQGRLMASARGRAVAPAPARSTRGREARPVLPAPTLAANGRPSRRDRVAGTGGAGHTLAAMSEPTNETSVEIKPRSHEVTDGYERAPARAMLRAVGMTDDDWGRAQVGVCSSWNE